MESVASFNSIVTDRLSRLAAWQRGALVQRARRFASLVSAASGVEVARDAALGHLTTTLRITSGLHRGATMELPAAEYIIGCGKDCDIVLRGAEVAARHCRLTREWSGMTVFDLRPAVEQSVTARRVNYDGGAIELEYDVGGVQFSLRHPPPARAEPHNHAGSWPLLLIGIGALVFALTLTATSGSVKKTMLAADHLDNAHVRVVATSDLVEEARRALADDALRVELREGRLVVEGRTSRMALQNRVRALAEDLHGTVLVEDHITYVAETDSGNAPGTLPVTVRSVMVGDPTYFVTDSGAHYFIGGVLPDGAEVLAIDTDQIRFSRSGHIVAYKLP
jgi:hypothetical protein